MLELTDVGMRYRGEGGAVDVWALKELNLDVHDGEFVAIVGPSGCGKTTLLQIVAGLLEPSEGTARVEGDRITRPHPSIGVVFQQSSTFPWLTAEKNVEFSLRHRGWPQPDRRARVAEMFELVGLQGFERHYPSQLSGGMAQRVALARELAPNPKLLLMDEPFAALDEQSRLLLGDELLRLWRETGCTIVLITHSLTEAAVLADRVAVLSRRPGTVREIVRNPLPSAMRSSESIGDSALLSMTGHLWELLKNDATEALRP